MSSEDGPGRNSILMAFWSNRTVLHDWYATDGVYQSIGVNGDKQRVSEAWFCRPRRAVQKQSVYRFVGGAAIMVLLVVGVLHLVGEFRAGDLETWKAVATLVCLLVAVPIFLESLLTNILDAMLLGRAMKLITLDGSGNIRVGIGTCGPPSGTDQTQSLDDATFLRWYSRDDQSARAPMRCDINGKARGEPRAVTVIRFARTEFPWSVSEGSKVHEFMPDTLAETVNARRDDAEAYSSTRRDLQHVERWLDEYLSYSVNADSDIASDR